MSQVVAGTPAAQTPESDNPLDERTICSRLQPVIRLYAMRRLRHDDAVSDFVQDALLALIEALREGRVSAPDQVAPYAIGICRNLLRDGRRTSERRSQLLQIHGPMLAAVGADPSPYTTPAGRARLEDCVSKLQRRARDVLQRAYFEGAANGEIAGALGIGEGNVRVIRHRAIESLRTCLERPMSWSEVA